jgi:hypothetical protein
MEIGREPAHCASNVCASPGFSSRKARTRRDFRSLAAHIASPEFHMEFAALPWDSSVNRFAAVPQTGSALHHLVTAVSIKKALMRPTQKPRWKVGPGSGPKAGLACPGTKFSQLVPAGRDDIDSWHQIKMCDSSASMMRAAHTRLKCEAATGSPLRG